MIEISSIARTVFATSWPSVEAPIEKDFPEFLDFLKTSGILTQLKITRDSLQIINGVPAILVEGEWMAESDVYRRFEICKSDLYHSTFVVDKETRDVYTYLDNGKGLQKHHPFLSALKPIQVLSEEEYHKTLAVAQLFIRSEAAPLEERTCILEYVSSWVNNGDSNFARLIENPKHPFLRLIIGEDLPDLNLKKGEVYEVGYWPKEVPPRPLCSTTQGFFQSPDPWEYKPSDKIVTHMAITPKEASRLYQFTQKYHADRINLGHKMGFHVMGHNCCVYLREACLTAGIDIPTEISLKETIHRICPDRIADVCQKIRNYIPQKLSAVCTVVNYLTHKIMDLFMSCVLLPIRVALGDGSGEGGRLFHQPKEPQKNLLTPLRNFRNWFSFSHIKLNLPAIAQEWQLKQKSTIVYKNNTKLPIRLTIIPI